MAELSPVKNKNTPQKKKISKICTYVHTDGGKTESRQFPTSQLTLISQFGIFSEPCLQDATVRLLANQKRVFLKMKMIIKKKSGICKKYDNSKIFFFISFKS